MKFSTRLKELRKGKKITQTALGAAIGITLKQIQRYERDENEPTLPVLIALADYFDVSLDYLTGRSNCPDIVMLNENGKPVFVIEAMAPPTE